MRIFSLIPALAALVTAVAGVSLPRADDCGAELPCNLVPSVSKRDFLTRPVARTVPGLTNAELLRRGLPLKNPIMRRGSPVRRTNPSATPPQPGNVIHRGTIRVKNRDDGTVLGYVSSSTLKTGQYRYEPDISQALIVRFETDGTGSGTQLCVVPENSDIPGFLGLVQGRDDDTSDLSSGSFQYVYLAGTSKTGPGSTPESVGNSYTSATGLSRTAESAVWTYDSGTGSISPHWVNTDKSTPEVQYFVQSTAVYIGGDQDAFFKKFPAPVVGVVFDFGPLGASG